MADTELEVRDRAQAPAAEPLQPAPRVDRVTTIRPAPRWPHLDVRELWHYRELLGTLAWRDVAVRYKQTSIGVDLGDPPAVPHHGRLHVRLRPLRQLPVERRAVPDLRVLGAPAVDVLRGAVGLASSSLVSNRGARDEGLLPADPPAARGCGRAHRGLLPRVHRPRRDDGLVPGVAEPGHRPRAALSLRWRS